jgi:integrase
MQLLRDQRELTAKLERATGQIIPWVFHHRGGRPIRGFHDSWRSACKAAGCPGKFLHDFRRTAARRLMRAVIPEKVVMQLLGHRTRSILDRYHIIREGDLEDALARISPENVPHGDISETVE